MTITVHLSVEQLAQAIKQLDSGELETLSILLDPKLKRELLKRRRQAQQELASNKLLTTQELFDA
jgi:hypothetical protein